MKCPCWSLHRTPWAEREFDGTTVAVDGVPLMRMAPTPAEPSLPPPPQLMERLP